MPRCLFSILAKKRGGRAPIGRRALNWRGVLIKFTQQKHKSEKNLSLIKEHYKQKEIKISGMEKILL